MKKFLSSAVIALSVFGATTPAFALMTPEAVQALKEKQGNGGGRGHGTIRGRAPQQFVAPVRKGIICTPRSRTKCVLPTIRPR